MLTVSVTTISGFVVGTLITITPPVQLTPTATAGSSNGGGESGGLQLTRSDVIAIVMGYLAILATVLAGFLARKTIVRVVREKFHIHSSSRPDSPH